MDYVKYTYMRRMTMKNGNGIFLFLAILAVVAMSAIGIAVAERSVTGILISLVVFIAIFGLGFKTKKKMREQSAE
ncbi:YlaF family protein [Jeotgalibacillus sp. R-1-5s-1]|uniref:YlaF family protein n=1 Tax=Jeotgalibacillus sp. R-1-5s-1 TaxID=2555897 RepID=UPI001FC7CD7E|nr:YlaF family protein [Jeotgalibacillus sp. R-1-5s-1]